MADGVDIISDTTGQKIVSALNKNRYKWVCVCGADLYDNYDKTWTKDGVEIGSWESHDYGGPAIKPSSFGDVFIKTDGAAAYSYQVLLRRLNFSANSVNNVFTKISAPGNIIAFKAYLHNAAGQEHQLFVVNEGNVIVDASVIPAQGGGGSSAYSVINLDFTSDELAPYRSNVLSLGAYQTDSVWLYGFAVCYEE